MILVVGASGMLGREVAAELLRRGQRVRVAGRKTRKLAILAGKGAETVQLDLRKPGGFAAALAGVETMFTAVHGLMGRASDSVVRVDVEGQKALIDAAVAAGVRRYVHTSVQNADAASPVAFIRAKAAAERHLIASGLGFTILRPSAFADLYAHDLIGKSVLAGRRVWLLGSGNTRRNLVAVADVAQVAVRALLEDGFSSKVLEIGGPDNFTEREVAALYGRLSGKEVKISSLSPKFMRRIAALAGPIHGGVRNLLIFMADLDGRDDLCFDAGQMPALLGRPPTCLDDFVTARLSR